MNYLEIVKAYKYLMNMGFDCNYSSKVKDCIRAHRFRSKNRPLSLEARILFDADKIDVTGALGIARTIAYAGEIGEPLYSMQNNKEVSDGSNDTTPSFFHEYKYKLEGIYSALLTQ